MNNKTKTNGNTTLSQRLIDCNDTVMTLDDVAMFLGKSREAILKMCQRKQLPAHKHLRTWMLLKSEVVAWMRNR